MKLKTKILLSLILIPMGAFALVSLIGFINVRTIALAALDAGNALGENAVRDSRRAMHQETMEELEILATEQALVIDMRARKIAMETGNIAALCRELWTKPELSGNPLLRKLAINADADEFSPFSIARGANPALAAKDLELLAVMYNSMKFMHACNPDARAIGVGTVAGAWLKYAWPPGPPGFDPRQCEWYKQALASPEESVWSGPHKSVASPDSVLTCARAVSVAGRVEAVVMTEIAPAALARDLIVGAGNACEAFIMDRNGCVIARDGVFERGALWNSVNSAEERYGEELVRAAASRRKVVKRYVRDGKMFYVGFAPAPSLNWSIGVLMPGAAALAPAVATQRKIEEEAGRYREHINKYVNNRRLVHAAAGLLILLGIAGVAMYVSSRFRNSIAVLENGAAAIGAGRLDTKIELQSGDELQDLAEAFNAMSGNLKTHIGNMRASLAERQRMERELAIAAQIQQSMLPRRFPAFPDRHEFDIFAATAAAREVGGDFYDFFFIDAARLYFCIGDVSGKGIPAAMFMAKAKALFRYEALSGVPPDQVLVNAGNALEKNNFSCMFASAICAALDVTTGELVFANAGHNPPLLCAGGKFEYVMLENALVIGGLRQERGAFKAQRLRLNKGDILFLYTDGVTEAMNGSEQEYGAAQLRVDLNAMAGANPKEIIDFVSGKVAAHVNGAARSDDITMLSLKFHG